MAQSFRSNIFGGYNHNDVDTFYERIGKEIEKLQKENSELRELLEAMRIKLEYYQQMENTLHNAILVAQKSSEQVRENANREAELIKREAEQVAKKEIASAENKVRELNAEYLSLQHEATTFRANFKALLSAQQEVIGKYFN